MSLYNSLNSLKDSKHLSTFLLDLLSTGDLPNWCEKSGKAVCSWIEQLVTENNIDGAVSLANLVMNYTQLENNSNNSSFVEVYLKLNMFAEKLDNTYSDTKWTFISFWQAVNDLHMTLLKLCPELFEEHVMELGDNFLETICNLSAPLFLRQLKVKALSCLMQACPSSEFNETHLDSIPNLMMVLSSAGDYDFQTSLVEVVMRMSSLSQRKKHESEWFSGMQKKDRKLFFSIKDFEPDCRLFLNSFNTSMGKERNVFTFAGLSAMLGKFKLCKPNAENYEHLWIDFNLGSRTVSVLFQYDGQEAADQERQWDTIMVYDYEVLKAVLDQSLDIHTLVLHLRKPPEELFVSPPSEAVRNLLDSVFLFQFALGDILPVICSTLFEETLQLTENGYVERQKKSMTKNRVRITSDSISSSHIQMETSSNMKKPKVSRSDVVSLKEVPDPENLISSEIDSQNFIPSSNPVSDHCSSISYAQLKSVTNTPCESRAESSQKNESSGTPAEPAVCVNTHTVEDASQIILSDGLPSYQVPPEYSNDVDIVSPVPCSNNFQELSTKVCHSQNPIDSQSDVRWEAASAGNASQQASQNPASVRNSENIGDKEVPRSDVVTEAPLVVDENLAEAQVNSPESEATKNSPIQLSQPMCVVHSSDDMLNEENLDKSRNSYGGSSSSKKTGRKRRSALVSPKESCHFSGAKSPHHQEGSRISLYNAQSPELLDGTPPGTIQNSPNRAPSDAKFKKKEVPKRIRNRARKSPKPPLQATPGPLKKASRKKRKEERTPDHIKSIYSDLSDESVDSYGWLNEKSYKRKHTTKTYGNSSKNSTKKEQETVQKRSTVKSTPRDVPSRSAAKKALKAIFKSGTDAVSQNSPSFASGVENSRISSPEVLRDTSYKTTIDYEFESAFSVGKFAKDASTSDHDSNGHAKLLEVDNQIQEIEQIQKSQLELQRDLKLAGERDVMDKDLSSNGKNLGPLHSTPIRNMPRVTYVKEPGASTCQKRSDEVRHEFVSPSIADDVVALDLEPHLTKLENADEPEYLTEYESDMSPGDDITKSRDKRILCSRNKTGSNQRARPKPRFRSVRKSASRKCSQTKSKTPAISSSMSMSGIQQTSTIKGPNNLEEQNYVTPTGPRRRKLFPSTDNATGNQMVPCSIIRMIQDQMMTLQQEVQNIQWRTNLICDVLKDCLKGN